ncbi:4-(cytidine 5'-diphospho)-2-C-methyl-D-erythritol kinase [Corynebacterium uberis]|uniref:4-(cytidine 5'-diphospho)-2-C-methyl-D-erythritol kinase n=1 Tax=Corynebacterium TaxID=1716 RepID=UPI001D0A5D04|nr:MULTISPECIES: 4-(cytidine 5'-diphospho)-2-C-methyl-D-erythritol kinase [Corynebacterium]MCZ9308798.1 4-(cytidine 5'-diphospho)-2-C-methyl-D-erythritol kinase [Corynebacterium sp. c6VSa_13]UDL72674.1 4-(cytidine 5'-diphospho)-2-C-methyl-D-erythritol kinase [Corynebacterium uberis]UDL76450.1 4-(cytidine 5'-diphospho)-2-C-methyl-D-erythritol kinase [Corynebacterium uberis]UDL78662.1 4-(cytidine 5'-diphospho)-2-C-methyl-D-erythritol kinase [Corynebacterium uberis]UDL80941.1 4-(cytidine 5'-dipho
MGAPLEGSRTVRAVGRAKVNLHLGVGPARPDGFHELATVFQSLSLADQVTLRCDDTQACPPGEPVVRAVTVSGLDAAAVPCDASNLAARAVEAIAANLRAKRGAVEVPAIDLEIVKAIPTAGGMAGGSADAAAALVAANAALGAGLDQGRLLELAAQLGSDVPFTLLGGTMLGTGRGEKLTPMLARGQYHWVFALPGLGLSTPRVFAKLDELRGGDQPAGPAAPDAVAAALAAGDVHALARSMRNELEPAALSLEPRLRRIHATARELGALRALVSGSGPTIALLCEDAAAAAEVAEGLVAANLVSQALPAHSVPGGAQLLGG